MALKPFGRVALHGSHCVIGLVGACFVATALLKEGLRLGLRLLFVAAYGTVKLLVLGAGRAAGGGGYVLLLGRVLVHKLLASRPSLPGGAGARAAPHMLRRPGALGVSARVGRWAFAGCLEGARVSAHVH